MSEPRLIISYLLWSCDHGNQNPEVRFENGALKCEVCQKEVTQWVTRTTSEASLDDFPELAKLGTKARLELMAFAARVKAETQKAITSDR